MNNAKTGVQQRAKPKPSLKRSAVRPSGLIRWYAVHFRPLGSEVMPLSPSKLKRYSASLA